MASRGAGRPDEDDGNSEFLEHPHDRVIDAELRTRRNPWSQVFRQTVTCIGTHGLSHIWALPEEGLFLVIFKRLPGGIETHATAFRRDLHKRSQAPTGRVYLYRYGGIVYDRPGHGEHFKMHANGRPRTYLRYSLATIFLKEADSVVWTGTDARRFGHVNYPLIFSIVLLGYSRAWQHDGCQ